MPQKHTERRRCARLRIPGLITFRKGGAPARRFPGADSARGLPSCPAAVAKQVFHGRRVGVDVAECGAVNRAPRWRVQYPSPGSCLGGLGRR